MKIVIFTTTDAQKKKVNQMADNNQMATVQTLAPPTIAAGYTAVREIGKDEIKEMIKRAGLSVEYADKKENPARCLVKSAELRRFVCAVLVKIPSRKASFIVGDSAPVVISAKNIDADYLKFASVFELAAKKFNLVRLSTKTFIRADETTYMRAYVHLNNYAPFYAKEEIA